MPHALYYIARIGVSFVNLLSPSKREKTRRLIQTLLASVAALLLAGCWPDPPTPIPKLVPDAVPPQTISINYPNADIRELIEATALIFHLKLDLPPDLRGRTSIKLREVSWRQIFSIVLSPIGYDFFEEDGTVIVRTPEEIASLPPVSKTVVLQHLRPQEAAAYLTRVFRGHATFTPTGDGVAYHVSRKRQQAVKDEILRIDNPDTVPIRFTKTPRLPEELPPLTPAPQQAWELSSSAPSNAITTNIFIFDHIDAELAVPHIARAVPDTHARVQFDIRSNALIVTAPESRMGYVQAIATYLDDERWYEPEP